MAITRRQFVTRLGALAAVVGFSQAEVSKIAEAFGANTTAFGGTHDKPRVIWVHGAECTGCSTSLLGILESPSGHPLPLAMPGVTTADAAVTLGGVEAGSKYAGKFGVSQAPGENTNLFTLWTGNEDNLDHTTGPLHLPPQVNAIERAALINIADVVIDVIDLQYHETVMGMGGDLAAKWLDDFANYTVGSSSGPGELPFLLVVEGALQNKNQGGAWGDTAGNGAPWCSIGMTDDGSVELDMPTVVEKLAKKSTCKAIIPIGQCACFGGYPGCKPNISTADAGFTATMSQTGAMGVGDYLKASLDVNVQAAAAKVINVPGCPTNPWWFVLTVVLWMADYITGDIHILDGAKMPLASAVDSEGRLKLVYPINVHGGYCSRHDAFKAGVFALHPGEPGCLNKIGCKGMGTKSLCGIHGWNNQQPENSSAPGSLAALNPTAALKASGGHCTRAGHPCMACTEKGYPDAFVPYVKI